VISNCNIEAYSDCPFPSHGRGHRFNPCRAHQTIHPAKLLKSFRYRYSEDAFWPERFTPQQLLSTANTCGTRRTESCEIRAEERTGDVGN
jgi:hypothetical protein